MWTSADGFKKAADQFNKWGEQTKSMGMQFGFHNHNYEFQKFGNTDGIRHPDHRAPTPSWCAWRWIATGSRRQDRTRSPC